MGTITILFIINQVLTSLYGALTGYARQKRYKGVNTVQLEPDKNYMYVYTCLAYSVEVLDFGFITCNTDSSHTVGTRIHQSFNLTINVSDHTLTMPSEYTYYNCLTLFELPCQR